MAQVVLAFVVVMLGTTLPTPLYAEYQRDLGFPVSVSTVVFAVYAVGVIGALVLLGDLSDRVGRRPLLALAVTVAAVSSVVFALADGLPALLLGRLLSGVSAGVATGTATTAVVELAPESWARWRALVATAANTLGLGLGPLVSGALDTWGPAPLRTPFLLHLALLVPAAVAVARLPEPVRDRAPLRWPHLRPRPLKLSVPAEVRGVFVPAAVTGVAGFATFGLFSAVEPAFLASVVGIASTVVAGAVAFLVFASSCAAQALGVGRSPRTLMPVGCAALVTGMALLALSLVTASLGVLLVATVVLGTGQGFTFRAAVQLVGEAAPAGRRAEVTSTLFAVLYVGLAVPVLLVGLLTQLVGLRPAALVFCALVALAAVAGGVAAQRSRA